ncbi:MAG: pantetheine-phosphate adenylyltransferase [Lachnospiraceae bacterium]|nr:pantetheine-phosphate adenylyltransferase [Lachnospiraceae bacterium]
MKTAIYPGSFDPVTYGHIDIIKRAAGLFDKIIVAVLDNPSKSPLFSVDERVTMLKEVTAEITNVEVDSFSGLLIDYAKQKNVDVAIRGLRAVTDFDYELHMAQTNALISEGRLETVFLTTDLAYSFLCSSTVREIASFNGDVSQCVPECVRDAMSVKFGYK